MTDTTGDQLAWHESRPTFRQVPDWLLMHPEVSDGALALPLPLAGEVGERSEPGGGSSLPSSYPLPNPPAQAGEGTDGASGEGAG